MMEKKTRACGTCHRFLPKEEKDPHLLCFLCRPCSQATPCEFDLDWTAEDWDAFEKERAAKREAERQRKEQRRTEAAAAKEAASATALQVPVPEPDGTEGDSGELDYEEEDPPEDMPVQTRLEVVPDISQTIRELFSSPEFTAQLATFLQPSQVQGKKEESSQGTTQSGEKPRPPREPSSGSSSSSSPSRSSVRSTERRSHRDHTPSTEGHRSRDRSRHRSRDRSRDRSRRGSPRARRSRERASKRDHMERARSRERRSRSHKRSRDRSRTARRTRTPTRREPSEDRRERRSSRERHRSSRRSRELSYDRSHRGDSARSIHDYSRDRSRSHHDEDRYDEERHGGDRDGRRTPRSHRDRQLRTREDSHREEPPSYSRREDDGRDYGDRDRGRQGYPHDTHMERDLRSQPPLMEASGSGYRRHPYGHEREKSPLADAPSFSPSRASSQGTSKASLSQPVQSSAWDLFLGPAEPEDPPPAMDPDSPDIEWSPPRASASSPAFKPSYTRPQLGADCPAKRKLDMGGGEASGLPPTASEKEKIRNLGDPYATNKVPDNQSEAGQDPPLRFLSPEVSAPFFAAAMLDAGIPVHFPPDEGSEAGELGEAEKARVRKPIRPWIPMTQSLQRYVRELQQAGRAPPRKTWISKSFPASPESEAEFFSPPLIPTDCWRQMETDQNSWCKPDKAPPPGVEGGLPATKPPQPHKVFKWNEPRDRELRELEQLARDGLRVSNSSLLAFAHLINGRLDKNKDMQPEAEKRCLYTLRDLLHVLAEQYARLAFRLAIHRKQNAIKALNLADKTGLSKTPVTADLFGGKWPQFKEAEMTRRKERLEAEKAKKASQKKGGGSKSGSNQSFRAPQNANPSKPGGSQKQGGSFQKGHGGGGGKGGGGRKDGASKEGGGSGTGSGASKGGPSGSGGSSGRGGGSSRGHRGGGKGGRSGGGNDRRK